MFKGDTGERQPATRREMADTVAYSQKSRMSPFVSLVAQEK
jgi:hypothetical protein